MNSAEAFVKSPHPCPDNTGLTHLASYGWGSKGSGIVERGPIFEVLLLMSDFY